MSDVDGLQRLLKSLFVSDVTPDEAKAKEEMVVVKDVHLPLLVQLKLKGQTVNGIVWSISDHVYHRAKNRLPKPIHVLIQVCSTPFPQESHAKDEGKWVSEWIQWAAHTSPQPFRVFTNLTKAACAFVSQLGTAVPTGCKAWKVHQAFTV